MTDTARLPRTRVSGLQPGPGAALLALTVALAAAASHADSVRLDTTLVAPGTYNRLDIYLSYSGTGGGSDSDTTDLSGKLPLILDLSFDDNYIATATGIAFEEHVPGTVSLTDMHLGWKYLGFVNVSVNTAGIRATARTPLPPGSVSNGTFPGAPHVLILNSGTATPAVSPQLVDPPAPVDLSVTPLEAPMTDTQGTIDISNPVIAGNTATYTVTVTIPVAFDENLDASTRFTGSGTIRSTAQFSRTIPPPHVDNLSATINGSLASLTGSLAATGSVPANVAIYWGDIDRGASANGWRSVVELGSRGAGSFAASRLSIVRNQDYAYRCHAVNAFGESWAAESIPFIWLQPIVAVHNADGATGLTSSAACLTGLLTAAAPEPAEAFICWGTADGGTTLAAWEHVEPVGDTWTHRLIDAGAEARAWVPTHDIGLDWTQPGYDDTAWPRGSLGVGYDTQPTYAPYIGLDVGPTMNGSNTTCYVRIPFVVDTPAAISVLTLHMRYDDGFVAYINGTEVARANAPDALAPGWQANAAPDHPDNVAVKFESFYISAAVSLLRPGTNMLAIHGLNGDLSSSDFLLDPRLAADAGGSLALTATVPIEPDTPYFYRCLATNALTASWAPETMTFLYESDADHDGMPDEWEQTQFGGTAETAAGDWDHDGFANWCEWYAGTLPTNAASLLAATGLAHDDAGRVYVRWSSVAGKTYAVERADNGLRTPTWHTLQTNIAATAPTNTYVDTPGALTGPLYRIRVE